MKKKFLTVLIVLALTVVMFTVAACGNGTLFEKNNERDMSQISATVQYAGRSSQVTKSEVNNAIYSWIYQIAYYVQQGYYSSSYYQSVLDKLDESFQQANEGLARTEAYTLKCMDVLYNDIQNNGTAAEKDAALAASTVSKAYSVSERIAEIETLLSEKYLIAARKEYNDEMQEAFDSYRKAYEEEIENSSRTTKSVENIEEVYIDTLPAKLVYEKGESSLNLNGMKVFVKYTDNNTPVELVRSDYTVTGFDSSEVAAEKEITVTFGASTAKFNVEIVSAKPSRPAMPKDEDEAEDTEAPERFEVSLDSKIEAARSTDVTEYKTLKEAKRRLEKSIESNYRTYDYYYLSKLKTQVVNQVEDQYADTVQAATIDEITIEYNKDCVDQLENLKTGKTKYETTEDSSSFKTQVVHTDDGYFYVQHILFKLTDDLQAMYDTEKSLKVMDADSLAEYGKTLADKVGVYISNVEYDKDAKCEEENCDCKECANYNGDGPYECDGTCSCVKCPHKRFVTKDYIENVGEFIPGFAWSEGDVTEGAETINVHSVMKAMFADLGEVTADSTAEERKEILEKFKKWTYMCCDDTDSYFSILSDGRLGYMYGKTSVSSTEGFAEDFTALSKALGLGEGLEDWTIYGSGVGSYGYCYSSYGIHVIMLTGYAVDEASATKVENDAYRYAALDSIVNYYDYETPGEGEIAKGTLAAYIGESIVKDGQEDAKGAFKQAFAQKEFEDEKVTVVKYYEDVYEDLIDGYKNA